MVTMYKGYLIKTYWYDGKHRATFNRADISMHNTGGDGHDTQQCAVDDAKQMIDDLEKASATN